MRISLILFSIPLFLLTAFLYTFILWNLYYSFTDYSVLKPNYEFVGLSTYLQLFTDPLFQTALFKTLLWIVVLVGAGNLVGLLVASLIYNINSARARNILTAYFIYPLSLSLVVSGIIWRWLLDVDRGVGKYFGNPLQGDNAFWSISLVSVWAYSGLATLFYLAMFYNIDKAQLESAQIDGASRLYTMLKVVIPQSRQSLIISTIFFTLFSIQMFDLPYSILFLNPNVMTLVMYTFMKFTAIYIAVASATAVVIIAISAIIVIPYSLLSLKKWIR
ncbi:multiple sugar transport permease protein [Pyrobaculum aerophilum str. IM2]|uniref:Multiple sugar transport permease protein n=2 Tax=Pyrobaculum aerophilum TaxID=13773 RepID=Q8ZYN9_PYRAE|nr:multiple sugar transport permease protein [Pyrobaculum aerophilum str. IM2]HII46090.1 sugar ABC transporter permease [Pyrobaculum aerophilum]